MSYWGWGRADYLPDALGTDGVQARALHTYGKSYLDLVRGFAGQFTSPPDWVATPRAEQEIEDLLDWATGARVAVVPRFYLWDYFLGRPEHFRRAYPSFKQWLVKKREYDPENRFSSQWIEKVEGFFGPLL